LATRKSTPRRMEVAIFSGGGGVRSATCFSSACDPVRTMQKMNVIVKWNARPAMLLREVV
jgi:hypothetical protein